MISTVKACRHQTTAFRLACFAILLVAGLLISSCSRQTETPAYEPTEWQGVVDESLPEATQHGQEALIRLFAAIQEVGIENLEWDCPDVRFDESFDEFFEGAVDFHRWQWAGEPHENKFPVRLTLRRDDADLTKVEHLRTYQVTRNGRLFLVRRVTDEIATR